MPLKPTFESTGNDLSEPNEICHVQTEKVRERNTSRLLERKESASVIWEDSSGGIGIDVIGLGSSFLWVSDPVSDDVENDEVANTKNVLSLEL